VSFVACMSHNFEGEGVVATMTAPRTPRQGMTASDVLVPLVSGGFAGALSRTLLAPLERVKVLLQVQEVSLVPPEMRYKGIVDALKRIPAEQGFLAFWRGNGVNVARMIPNSAIKFATYDSYKRLAFPDGEGAYSGREQFLRKMVRSLSRGKR